MRVVCRQSPLFLVSVLMMIGVSSNAEAQLSGLVNPGIGESGLVSDLDGVIDDVVDLPEVIDEDSGESAGEEPDEGEATEETGGVVELNDAVEAVRQQRAIPLEQLLSIASQYTNAPVIDVQLILVEDVLFYQVRTMTGNGIVNILHFYAVNGQPLLQ